MVLFASCTGAGLIIGGGRKEGELSTIFAWSIDGSRVARIDIETTEVVILELDAQGAETEVARFVAMNDLPGDVRISFQPDGNLVAVLIPWWLANIYNPDAAEEDNPQVWQYFDPPWAGSAFAWGPGEFTVATGDEQGQVQIFVNSAEATHVIETGIHITDLLLTDDTVYVSEESGTTYAYTFAGEKTAEFVGVPLYWFADEDLVLVTQHASGVESEDYPDDVIVAPVVASHIALKHDGTIALADQPIGYLGGTLVSEKAGAAVEFRLTDGVLVPVD